MAQKVDEAPNFVSVLLTEHKSPLIQKWYQVPSINITKFHNMTPGDNDGLRSSRPYYDRISIIIDVAEDKCTKFKITITQ
jgi:hypothetical protein